MAPATIGAIGLGASGAGAGLGAIGSLVSGFGGAASERYQAGVALQNAQIAKQNAEYTRETGENNAALAGQQGRAQMGKIVTSQAANGFEVNSGTSQKVQQSAQSVSQMNQTIIRSNALKQAYDYDVQSTQDINQANEDKAAATNDEISGAIGAVSSIVGGASSVSTKWLQGRAEGLWGS